MAIHPLPHGVRWGDTPRELLQPDQRIEYDVEGNPVVTPHITWWDKALPYIIGSGFAYGQLAPLFGIGAGGAGGVAGEVAGVENAVLNAVGGGAVPLGGVTAAGTGAGAAAGGAAGGAGAEAAKRTLMQQLLSPQGLASLAALVPSAISAFSGPSGGGSASQAQEQLLQEALRRSQRVDPLHRAATQLAFSRLPTSAREGISLTGQ
jgi:hypothetical protein